MLHDTIIENYTNHGLLAPEWTVDTTPKTILEKLTATGIKYTWETVKDERIDNVQSVIEVRVYLPGHILYGRHIYKTADASDAHLYAISNAVQTIVCKTTKVETPAPISQPTPQPEPVKTTQQPATQEDILGMLQETGVINTPITTAEQLNNDPRDEVPFEDFALDANELDKLIGGNISTQQNTPAPVTQQPQNTINGFTQEQIQAINNFKQQMGITDDAVLCNYINAWDNKLSKKTDLTPNNIDSFIEWTKSVGKSPC